MLNGQNFKILITLYGRCISCIYLFVWYFKMYFKFNIFVLNSYIIDEFKKFVILKKEIGIESQNLCKQSNDQKTTETR